MHDGIEPMQRAGEQTDELEPKVVAFVMYQLVTEYSDRGVVRQLEFGQQYARLDEAAEHRTLHS